VFVGASVTYATTIHAQPYGWVQVSGAANGATLQFVYNYKSTSGNLSDLVAPLHMYEYVTYGGSGGYFTPQSPPFNVKSPGINDPTVTYWTPSVGSVTDTQGEPPFCPVPTCQVAGSFTGTQAYEFDDPITGKRGYS